MANDPSPSFLARKLESCSRFGSLHHVPECSSTQDLAADALRAGLDRPAVFLTDRQTAGRGRQGRAWDDGGDDLAVTFTLPRFALPEPTLLPAALPVALRRAVAATAPGVATRIKWPNDLLVVDADGPAAKLAGLLVDVSGSPPDVRIGIGVNVGRRAFPPELAGIATSLARAMPQPPTRDAVLLALAAELEALLTDLATGALERWHAGFAAGLGLAGRPVSLRTADGERCGTLATIDLRTLRLAGDAAATPLPRVLALGPAAG